ncbi:MAG: S1 RNA-binding domain-containing protein, partial [Candidatus Thermoplasmatota archaeon]|nr:S1 RNA-binding domain-containing protein [Candidatus Thermoplasmatota archaeon]
MSPAELPEEGEFVIGRVSEVRNHGADVELLEYPGQKGFVHISEVASGWVKYIR